MEYLTLSQILTSEYNEQYLNNNSIQFVPEGDKSEDNPNFEINSNKSRIEQVVEIYEEIYIDGHSSYCKKNRLDLESFNLLDIILELVNFKGSYEEYLEIRKIVKAREVRSDGFIYLVLYFFVDEFLISLEKVTS